MQAAIFSAMHTSIKESTKWGRLTPNFAATLNHAATLNGPSSMQQMKIVDSRVLQPRLPLLDDSPLPLLRWPASLKTETCRSHVPLQLPLAQMATNSATLLTIKVNKRSLEGQQKTALSPSHLSAPSSLPLYCSGDFSKVTQKILPVSLTFCLRLPAAPPASLTAIPQLAADQENSRVLSPSSVVSSQQLHRALSSLHLATAVPAALLSRTRGKWWSCRSILCENILLVCPG
ncbi:hypothetical protein ACJRO7_033745 [Eucalyptus globulus]|uniref:Uncharacterized protein n=1 Tax=Eucalyptus globulus TaxID=34317 RepID=A0ABD3J6F9_EUCGL